jgi:hypothetical protein
MGRHDTVWPVARPVEEVSVFARWTSEGAAPKDRPPLFSRAGSSRGRGRRPVVPPGDVRDVPLMQGTLDVRLPGRPPCPATASRSGSPLGVEEIGRVVQGDTVSTRSLLLEEVTVANKDKGGSKSSKTAASKSLKEKREAKKAKAAGSSSSSSANWTKK